MRIVVPEGQAEERIDRVLGRLIENTSRTTVQRWIAEARVTRAGVPCRAKDRVGAGAEIDVLPGPQVTSEALPDSSVGFEVLFEDKYLIVVDKPAGLVVHPARGHLTGTLVNGLLARPGFAPAPDSATADGLLRPGVVHRIDKDTSGLLVIAKDERAREGLKAQFASHSVERAYRALCVGVAKTQRLDTSYGRHPAHRLKFSSRVAGERRAMTQVRLLEALGNLASLVECRLETGRTHEIRVHLAEQGRTPVLGDSLYGRVPRDPTLAATARELGRQALHAGVLGFVHPETGQRLRFESPLPLDMQRALATLRYSRTLSRG